MQGQAAAVAANEPLRPPQEAKWSHRGDGFQNIVILQGTQIRYAALAGLLWILDAFFVFSRFLEWRSKSFAQKCDFRANSAPFAPKLHQSTQDVELRRSLHFQLLTTHTRKKVATFRWDWN